MSGFILVTVSGPCSSFYPRDAMLARVFATATFLSVRHALVREKEDRPVSATTL